MINQLNKDNNEKKISQSSHHDIPNATEHFHSDDAIEVFPPLSTSS